MERWPVESNSVISRIGPELPDGPGAEQVGAEPRAHLSRVGQDRDQGADRGGRHRRARVAEGEHHPAPRPAPRLSRRRAPARAPSRSPPAQRPSPDPLEVDLVAGEEEQHPQAEVAEEFRGRVDLAKSRTCGPTRIPRSSSSTTTGIVSRGERRARSPRPAPPPQRSRGPRPRRWGRAASAGRKATESRETPGRGLGRARSFRGTSARSRGGRPHGGLGSALAVAASRRRSSPRASDVRARIASAGSSVAAGTSASSSTASPSRWRFIEWTWR